KPEDVQKQYALIGNSFYLLKWDDGKLVMSAETGNVVGMLRVQEKQTQYPYGFNYGYEYGDQTPVSVRYTQMFDLLLSRSMSVSRTSDAEQYRLPPGLVRVFLYARIPPEFGIQNPLLGKQEGWVLYCIDLTATEESVIPAVGPVSE
ncbi:hypothetical protein, partial [Schlesneria sp.]